MTRHTRGGMPPTRSYNRYPSAPDGRGVTSPALRRKPHGKDPLAVETANDILEESEADHYYVYRGDQGATAVRVIYLDKDWVFDESTVAQSLAKAKLAVRAYRATRGLDNPFAPDHRWATIAPAKLS